ncbi:hypothetical protein AVEN_222652-1 [Araneus ventricosus]|uniref:Type II toxin-antitoxin system RelE/ParE family toxin n=1 Tax=Araneus ventricosus TaxID=182803 RepID=A0A4Y2SED1_ARAVE|nr:hypothetical protein AVEN_222652-1 [Araneus ventricosus]
MAFSVNWTKAAEKDYGRLISRFQRTVDRVVEEMEVDPFQGAKKLHNCSKAQWRKRAGNYRVLFDVVGAVVHLKAVLKKDDHIYNSVVPYFFCILQSSYHLDFGWFLFDNLALSDTSIILRENPLQDVVEVLEKQVNFPKQRGYGRKAGESSSHIFWTPLSIERSRNVSTVEP